MQDSTAFDELYDRLILKFPEIHHLVMDCGFKTPWICKRVLDDKRIPGLPCTKGQWEKMVSFVHTNMFMMNIMTVSSALKNHVLNYATTDSERIPAIQKQILPM